jgi:hypothetical protein
VDSVTDLAAPRYDWPADAPLAPGDWLARVTRDFHGCQAASADLAFTTEAGGAPPTALAEAWHGCGPWQVTLSWTSAGASFTVGTTSPDGTDSTTDVATTSYQFETSVPGDWRWRVKGAGGCGSDWVPGPDAHVAAGAVWTQVAPQGSSFTPREGHASAVSDDGATLWVMAGHGPSDTSDVWSSQDGAHWTLRNNAAPFPPRRWAAGAFFDGRLWFLGGNSNAGSLNYGDVWASTNQGAGWTKTADGAFAARHSPVALAFHDRLWVVGGEGPNCNSRADVWSTADGATWRQETADGGFPGRDWHAGAVFHERLWIAGGINRDRACDQTFLDDVWSSADGKAWTKEAAGAFAPRGGHTLTAFDDKLWIVAGTHAWPQATQGDVWYSEDGRTWCQAAGTAQFSRRYGHSAGVVGDRLWVVGGYDGTYQGDVWMAR